MHKNTPVCDLAINERGQIVKIKKVHEATFKPFGVALSGKERGLHIDEWWSNRNIPATRTAVNEILASQDVPTVSAYALKNLGLSLSDPYWVMPESLPGLTWESLNLFENDFATSQVFKTHGSSSGSSYNPDASTNGELPKFWSIEKNTRVLSKGGSRPFNQEPFNEYAASLVLDKLHLKHVQYWINPDSKMSVCQCFIGKDSEFVPAKHVFSTGKMSNNENAYTYMLRRIKEIGLAGGESFLNSLILFDYIIANEDRHFNNFGFIRDTKSLEFTDFAPIFDNGNSLWYKSMDSRIGEEVESKPFFARQARQLELIGDFRFVSDTVEIESIIQDAFAMSDVSGERIAKIASSANKRYKEMVLQ